MRRRRPPAPRGEVELARVGEAGLVQRPVAPIDAGGVPDHDVDDRLAVLRATVAVTVGRGARRGACASGGSWTPRSGRT